MDELMMITTVDNPYNPFAQWLEWFTYDTANGYNTCGLLGRIATVSESLNDGGLAAAQREIVRLNLSGKHILVTERNFVPLINAWKLDHAA